MTPATPGHAAITPIESAAIAARAASRVLATLDTSTKNALLTDLAASIAVATPALLVANASDMHAARTAGLADAKIRRLALTEASLAHLAEGLRQVASLPDPIGQVTRDDVVPSGLRVRRVRAPLGVVAMIYEARPGVTADAFALCFKSGNACILRGGKEAAASNAVLAALIHAALARHGLPEAAITVVADPSREVLRTLLGLDAHIDLVIPRGGTDLIAFVREHATIPTIQHYQGICHVYLDAAADLDMAERICVTAKTSAPAACNAAECLLVHRAIAPTLVPRLAALFAAAGVEVRADADAHALSPTTRPAAPEDFGREFLDLVVALRVVDDLDAAVAHIRRHGSDHTEAIVTDDPAAAARFTREVQSSCVLVNASTRFNDGFQLGLGAEIGISTSRLHAYGPMGLEELTTQRWIVEGTGQTR